MENGWVIAILVLQSQIFIFLKNNPVIKITVFYFEIQISIQKSDVKINLIVLPEPEDQGDKDYVKKFEFSIFFY